MQKPIAYRASELDAALGKFLAELDPRHIENMRSLSAAFCRTFGIRHIPRNPFTILPEVFGIKLRGAALSRPVAARWTRLDADDLYIIEYSNHRPRETMSLTLWHEFGEIIFAHPDFPARVTSDIECDLAMQFAINVTMPEAAVRKLAEEYGHPDRQNKTWTLASRFHVSKTAMRIRLAELGLACRPNSGRP